MPLTSPGNDDDTGENHQPTLRKNTAEPAQQTLKQYKRHHLELAKKIRRRRPDILRTIQLGYSNAKLEAFNNRIKAPSAWPTAATT